MLEEREGAKRKNREDTPSLTLSLFMNPPSTGGIVRCIKGFSYFPSSLLICSNIPISFTWVTLTRECVEYLLMKYRISGDDNHSSQHPWLEGITLHACFASWMFRAHKNSPRTNKPCRYLLRGPLSLVRKSRSIFDVSNDQSQNYQNKKISII